MSTRFQVNVFVEPMITIEYLMRETDRILSRCGAIFDVPTQVWLDDRDEVDSLEPQEVRSFDEAMQYLLGWPALGSVDYTLGPLSLDVGFSSFSSFSSGMLQVWMAFNGDAFRQHPESLPEIVALVHALHDGLNAVRSSFGWGLTDSSNDESEEAERLSLGVVVGTPWLDLLRRDLATQEHFEWLDARRGNQTTLERTTSGGLVWQRDEGPP